MSWSFSSPFGFYENYSGYESMIGRNFFYADKESGIGWNSLIEEIFANEHNGGYTLCLACGTRVQITPKDIAQKREKAFLTNMEN